MFINVFGEITEAGPDIDEVIKKWVIAQTGMKQFDGNPNLVDQLHSTMFWCVKRGYEAGLKAERESNQGIK